MSGAMCLLILLALVTPAARAQTCFPIRGRAVLYRGDGFFAIWHVGTHHIFYPADHASANLLCRYMDCTATRKQPALFADMRVCPTEPLKKGWAQPVKVTRVWHEHVVPDWRPQKGD